MNYIEIATRCLNDEADAVRGLIPLLDEQFTRSCEIILAARGKLVVTGVGKSGHIGAKIAATLSSTGTPSFFMNPLDAFHGDLGAIQQGDVVLAISNSGETDELLRFIPLLQEKNIPIIGMSGNPKSLLAQYATAHLNISVEHEACPLGLAPTSSTTATLAMGDALACALMEARHFRTADFAQYHPGGTLGRRLLTRASDVMHSQHLPVVAPLTTLGEALVHMTTGRLGLAVIMSDTNRVAGILTDGDVRRATERYHSESFDMPVEAFMSRHPKCVSAETKVSEIEKILQSHKIHCVLVVDEEKHLQGIVDSFSIQF